MVIIDEKGEEETPSHSEKYLTIQPILVPSEPLPSSSNWPPYLERLFVETNDPIPESSLASKFRNLSIKVHLLQAIKEVPIFTKIIRELCLKKSGRRRLEPQTIQFVGRVAELRQGVCTWRNIPTSETLFSLFR